MNKPTLKLNGFTFQSLFKAEGLEKLDKQFLRYLKDNNEDLHNTLIAYRYRQHIFTPKQTSDLLIECAKILEFFLADLFKIQKAVEKTQLETLSQDPIFLFKQWFVLREARRRIAKIEECEAFLSLNDWLQCALTTHNLNDIQDPELAIGRLGQLFLKNQEHYSADIEKLIQWCARALTDNEGRKKTASWSSFKLPSKVDSFNLVPMDPVPQDSVGRYEAPSSTLRQRDGFKLTDHRMTPRQVLNEVHYCVYCHKNEGDFCSKGFPVKKNEPEKGLKLNALGETMVGCPLEEKISEMHTLKKEGFTLGSLAMIMLDNPMCPITGHRICNDCMKSCIYQKQDPVNIPQVETGILTDVLALPWGVEIYDLLTRWNPLRQEQWIAKPYNGLKVLIMGMGPAGLTLAHHLLMEGFAVVGVDGLKIEPLPRQFLLTPIYSYEDIREELDTRIMAGFGGVAEYGITVRWDKNFLKLVYISLSRRPYFQVFGGVRFGGTLTVEDAWELGFDHMAIAVGAGLPKELPIPGSLAPGMRQANDFLMALQLTGAAKKCSLANLQVRLPAVIIGGGLTGIDTATEVQAYYIAQTEKMLERYETLNSTLGEARIRDHFGDSEFQILNEMITHGKEVRKERERAKSEKRDPNFIDLIRKWGGVSIVYRRQLRESPAYRRNHEEVIKAMEEGIYYAEGLEPVAVRVDEYGYVSALICRSRIYDELRKEWILSDEEHVIPAKSIFVATGARPNIAYEFEHRGTFHREGHEYQTYIETDQGSLEAVHSHGHSKMNNFGPFTSYQNGRFRVTFLGDTHPTFHGSVVKAIASAKRTYPKIIQSLGEAASAMGDTKEYRRFAEKMNTLFQARIKKIKRHTPNVIEIEIKAPLCVKNYRPGQFYRVQNFETYAPMVAETRLQSEGVAVLGTRINKKKGTLSLMMIEQGASSRLFATFNEGDPISIMGPTGVRTKIPHDKETVLIVGDSFGVAYAQSVGAALQKAGNKVLSFMYFQTADEVFCQRELESGSEAVVWVTQAGNPIQTRRPQDLSTNGDLVSALLRYAKEELAQSPDGNEIKLESVNRILVVGHQSLVKAFHHAQHSTLKNYFTRQPKTIASIYGPMQCMLKGVCAQCLQWQIDPLTGKRTKAVFACSWQDQPLEIVDLENLNERLAQNRTQEILTNLWLDYLFAHYNVTRI